MILRREHDGRGAAEPGHLRSRLSSTISLAAGASGVAISARRARSGREEEAISPAVDDRVFAMADDGRPVMIWFNRTV